MDTVIRGAIGILTGLASGQDRSTGDIRIADGIITEIGRVDPRPGDTVLDASGCVVYPGLISTHHHLFQSLMKGVTAGIDKPLEGWLRTVPYMYWDKHDEASLRISATVGMVELLLSGTTTIADHHYIFDEHLPYDPAEILFDVAARLGVRFVLCRGGATQGRSFDIPGTKPMPLETLDTMIDRVADLTRRFHDPAPDAMRRIVFAPTTPPWAVAPQQLDVIADAARRLGIRLHSHLSETMNYVNFCREQFNRKPVHWMADHGWVGPDVWYAHLVHLDDDEIAVLAETATGMSHCPQSNCRLGSGIAPADRLDAAGGVVSLAVDGAASNESADMISEMHSAWHIHRVTKGAATVSAEQVLRWATAGGATALGLPTIGTIEPGKSADLAIFDLGHPRYAGLHDPLIGPIVAAGSANPRHVLVRGRPVVVNGAIPGLDLRQLSADAAAAVRRMAA
jgi:cytosine/adenosine deaminase-related metal-dependent hydrolase